MLQEPGQPAAWHLPNPMSDEVMGLVEAVAAAAVTAVDPGPLESAFFVTPSLPVAVGLA